MSIHDYKSDYTSDQLIAYNFPPRNTMNKHKNVDLHRMKYFLCLVNYVDAQQCHSRMFNKHQMENSTQKIHLKPKHKLIMFSGPIIGLKLFAIRHRRHLLKTNILNWWRRRWNKLLFSTPSLSAENGELPLYRPMLNIFIYFQYICNTSHNS